MIVATVFRDIVTSRELLQQLIRRDLTLRYRQAIMGFAWALFLPALTITAGLILRMAMTGAGTATALPSIGGIAIKSWAWAFFSGAMNFATMSLLANAQLVTKIYFPREVLPVASIAAQAVDSALGLGILLFLGHWLGFQWSLQLLWVPVLLLALILLTTGFALLFACANLFYRDVKYILQVLLTFGIFFTPVLFEVGMFSPRVAQLLMLNPLSPILEGLRLTLAEGMPLHQTLYAANGAMAWSPWFLVYSLGAGLVATLIGMVAFRRGSAYFAEYY